MVMRPIRSRQAPEERHRSSICHQPTMRDGSTPMSLLRSLAGLGSMAGNDSQIPLKRV